MTDWLDEVLEELLFVVDREPAAEMEEVDKATIKAHKLISAQLIRERITNLKQLKADTMEPEQIGGKFIYPEVKEYVEQLKEFIDKRIADLTNQLKEIEK